MIMKKPLKEWFIEAPWGRIAMISWGNPKGSPVLLVHGRQDSVATFIPLLDLLPEDFYYVGMDLPGHGKSDPFPIGLMLNRFHFVTPVDIVVKHLKWKGFIYLSHSMGGEIGLFYNAIRPNHVTKFILLDTGVALQAIAARSFPDMFATYERYYNNYKNINYDNRVYTKEKAIESVMNARKISKELAEIVLSRNLKRIGGDDEELEEPQYQLSWDKRLKSMAHLNLPYQHYLYLFTKNAPPTLFITATSSAKSYENVHIDKLIDEMQQSVKNFESHIVEGNHDVHLTSPQMIAEFIVEFLNKEFVVSKL